jgi:hypothetical protein
MTKNFLFKVTLFIILSILMLQGGVAAAEKGLSISAEALFYWTGIAAGFFMHAMHICQGRWQV